ncbi:MAG: hypothetical protein JXR91_04315 [Deltaproteobacteria bacterium]|nr:hypothetical protein [Deltaproteobacteria bacterium]
MGGLVGGSAVAFARYFMNRMNERVKDANIKRKAGWQARRKTITKIHDAQNPNLANYREPFQCYYYCENCGYLSESNQNKCPYCKQLIWVNLANDAMGTALHDVEKSTRNTVNKKIHILVIPIYLLTIYGVYFTTAYFSAIEGGIVTAFIMATALGVSYNTTIKWWSFLFEKFNYKWPLRWRFPLLNSNCHSNLNKTNDAEIDGEETLISPFTGTKCLGYKAMVLFDIEGDARPPEWVLAEVVCNDININGSKFSGAKIMLDMEVKHIDIETVQPQFDFKTYLRQRGLFLYDGNFIPFETVIKKGDKYQVKICTDEPDFAVINN